MTTTPPEPVLPHIGQWVAALEERKRALSDPRRIAEMDLLIEHLVAEHERDLPRTLRTVNPRGAYHSWGGTRPYTATVDEQAEIYQAALDASPHTFDLEMEIERCFSGPDGIALDGTLHKHATAGEVARMGLELPEGADPDGDFVVSRRMALFVSYMDGLMAGEDMYRDVGGTVMTAAEWSAQRRSGQPVGESGVIA
jgi:hypothetical protein